MSKRRRRKSSRIIRFNQERIGTFWSRVRFPLLLIALALLPRLVALIELTDSPIFYQPAIDAKVYHDHAIRIAAGELIGTTSFWQAPLYTYFLGLVYVFFGVNILTAKIIQILLGAINCYLLFVIVGSALSKRAALIAYGISALYGPFIFFETELLAPVILNLLMLLVVLTLFSYDRHPRTLKLLVAGFLLGMATVGHGLAAAFLPGVAVWLFCGSRRSQDGLTRGAIASIFLLIGFLSVISVTAIRNYAVDKEFVPVSANFGANFYLGNHPNYDSTTAIRPGLEWDDFIQEAAAAGYQTPAQSSKYFTAKAVANIKDSPAAVAKLLFKKIYLLTGGEEIKRNLDVYHFRGFSRLLSLLMWKKIVAFPSGALIPLTLTWLVLFFFRRISSGDHRRQWLLILFILTQSAATLLFFVSSRYRLIMMPVSIGLAASMLDHILLRLKSERLIKLVPVVSIIVAFLIMVNMPRVELQPKDHAENCFYEGLAYAESGNSEAAIQKYTEAISLNRNYAAAQYNLAQMYFAENKNAESLRLLEDIVLQNPSSFMVRLVSGRALLEHGEPAKAESLFHEVLKMNPYSVEAHVNLGHLYRLRKDTTVALKHLRSALDIYPKAYKAYNQMGAVYLENQALDIAERHFRKAIELNPSYGSALNNLAMICSRTNRWEETEMLLSRAVEVDPNDVTPVLNLGAFYVQRGQPAVALKYLDRAVDLAPKMSQAHYMRGMALIGHRRTKEAVAELRKALELNPGFLPAREQLINMGY